jgi:hypothetical protein
MLHKPKKTTEEVADYWANWANTPEQAKALSEAIANCLRSYSFARGILENELTPSKARKKNLERLDAALRRVKAALSCQYAVNALLGQEHWKYRPLYEGCTREEANKRWLEANKQWPEIVKRFRNDIEAISRLCLLAADAVKEQNQPAKADRPYVPYEQRMAVAQGREQNPIGKRDKTASRSKQPWMVILGAGAESMWREVLGGTKFGKHFLTFYNEICDLGGEEPVSMNLLKKRREAWQCWMANGRLE